MEAPPFQTLGIAPTSDVLAIKRAYAKALKSCRPDDDPQGYQRLREALDWALALARQPAHEDEDEDEDGDGDGDDSEYQGEGALDHADGPATARPLEAAESAAGGDGHGHDTDASSDGAVEAEWVHPGQLAQSLHQYWESHGDAALVEAWPRLHYELDRLPFEMRAEASAWFANLVLDYPGLPPDFVEPLAAYFQWGEDYRSDALLGEERAIALVERLRDAGVRGKLAPGEAERYAELLHLKKLVDAGRSLRATLYAALASPKNDQRLANAAPGTLRALRIDDEGVAELRHKFLLAIMLRLLPLGLLFGGLAHASGAVGSRQAIGLGFLAAAVAPLAAGALVVLRGVFDACFVHFPPRWQQAGSIHLRFSGAVVLAALAGLLPQLIDATPFGTFCIAVACSLAAVLLVWGAILAWREVLPPTVIVLYIALFALLDGQLARPASGSLSIALVWTLLAHWAFVSRPGEVFALYRSPLRAWAPRSAWAWIAMVLFFKGVVAILLAVVLLALPLTYLVQALGYGTRHVATTLGLAVGAGLLFRETGQPWFFCLALTPLVTAAMQALSTWLSKRDWLRAG